MEPDLELKRRLRGFARKERRQELYFLWMLLGIVGGVCLVGCLILIKPWPIFLILPLIGFIIYRAVIPLNLKQTARRLEAEVLKLKDKLIIGLELSDYRDHPGPEGYSPALVEASIEDTAAALKTANTDLLLKGHKVKWTGLGLAGLLLGLVSYWGVAPDSFSLRFNGAFLPQGLPLSLSVAPGDTIVAPGETVELRLSVSSPYRFTRALFIKEGGDGIERESVYLTGNEAMMRQRVGEGFRYRFRVFTHETQTYRVGILEPLQITELEFTAYYPDYTRLSPQRFSSPQFSVVAGTRVIFSGRVESKDLSQGQLLLNDSAAVDLEVAGPNFKGELILYEGIEAKLYLKDQLGNSNEPMPVRIAVFKDEPPFVSLFIPGRDVDLPVDMRLPLGAVALDDYGLSELRLAYNLDNEGHRVRISDLAGCEETIYYRWDLTGLGLLPGDEVNYWVEVKDNDRISGPKIARSQVYRVRFPTMAQIYQDVTEATAATADRLSTIEKSQEALSQSLARLDEKLRRERELNWAEEEALAELLSEQESLLSELESLKAEISSTIEELETSFLLDPEAVAKLRKIDSLLQEILPADMKEMLEGLRRSIPQDYPQMLKRLKDLESSQDLLISGIDRTLEILKQLQIESKLNDLVEAAQRLSELQSRVDEAISQNPDTAFADEEEVRAGLKTLADESQALLDLLRDEKLQSQLRELLEALEDLKGLSAQLSQALQANAQADAQALSKELLSQLSALSLGLKKLKESFTAGQAAQIAQALMNSAQNLLFLSNLQEGLERSLGSGASLDSLASLQQSLKEGAEIIAESLSTLSRQSFMVSPQLGQEVIKAIQAMEGAQLSLVNFRRAQAQGLMKSAQAELAQAGHQILSTQGQLCGGGGGLESFLKQLSQLTMSQLSLNQQSGMVVPIPISSGLTPQQRSQLARIMSRQSQIRQSLESLLGSYSERPGLTGALDGVVEEMRKIEEGLKEQGLTRELLERQSRTLTRMLDAQRSIRQQDYYSRRREREVGKEYPDRLRPPPLPQDHGERQRYLREELMRGLKEGYPKEYEALIRAYYERLLNEL